MDYQYFQPGPELLAPARRAGIGMFVLSGLLLLCGACLGVFAAMGPMDKVLEQSGMRISDTGTGLTPEQFMRTVYTVMAVVEVLLGIVFVVLGVFVRRGGKIAAIFSLVFCVLLAIFMLMQIVGAVIMGMKNPSAFVGIIIGLIPLVLLGLVITWLTQAMRAAPQIDAQQRQVAAQIWQYQQQQQMMQVGGYGQPQVGQLQPDMPPTSYGYGSAPPAVPATPPPDSQSPPPTPPSA